MDVLNVRPGDYVIYTDGASKGNPGPGGWAWFDPQKTRQQHLQKAEK